MKKLIFLLSLFLTCFLIISFAHALTTVNGIEKSSIFTTKISKLDETTGYSTNIISGGKYSTELNKLPSPIREKLSAELNNIQKNIQKKGALWKADYNPISLKNDEEKKKLCGLKGTHPILKSTNPIQRRGQGIATGTGVIESGTTEPLPVFFDWRNQSGKNYMNHIVYYQGPCGSCWAFATTSALEGELRAYYNNPDLNLKLSEQDLVSCCDNGVYSCGDCSGGWPENALKYIKNQRIANMTCFGYTGTNDICANKCSDWLNGAWSITSYENVALTRETIKNAIVTKGPVIVGMTVHSDFFWYREGIYYNTTPDIAGYHAVTIVGFGIYDGLDYWIVRNSWGDGWGESGYFRILAGNSNIDSWFVLAIDGPIPPTPQEKICRDNDGDGYCNWGIGPKPSNCPSCSDIEDCDDSNSSIYAGCGMSTFPTGTLSLSSTPSGTKVYSADIDTGYYLYRGETPLLTNLNVGQRQVKVSKEDYIDNITTVLIKEGQTTSLYVELFLAPKIFYPLKNDIFRAGDIIKINGTAPGPNFKNYTIEYGLGQTPVLWLKDGINLVNGGLTPVTNNTLATWDTNSITKSDFYTIRLREYKLDGTLSESKVSVYLDPTLKKGWPQRIKEYCGYDDIFNEFVCYWSGYLEPVVADINNDGNKEIIVYAGGKPNKLYVFRPDGSLLNGWPVSVGTNSNPGGTLSIPVIVDINNDGFKEIIVSNDYDSNYDSKVYAFKYNGSILKGWPVNVSRNNQLSLITEDLNLDGKNEIVVQENILNDMGKRKMTILNGSGNIISQFLLPGTSSGAQLMSRPAVGNFDNDNELEIVYVSPNNPELDNKGVIDVFNIDGSEVKGWPVSTDGIIFSSPAVGDINNDGNNEIVVGLMFYGSAPNYEYGGVYAFDKNGNVLPGWPFERGWNFWSSPSLADFDNDGNLEISISRLGFYTYLIHHDGTLVTGWPQYTTWNDYYSTIIGDVNNDKVPDLLTTAGDGFYPSIDNHGGVYAWNFNGTPITGFPKVTEVDAQAPAVVSDIDNDGKIELIASSDVDQDLETGISKRRGTIYVWDISSNYNISTMEWPTFHHDERRTGMYEQPSPWPHVSINLPSSASRNEQFTVSLHYTHDANEQGGIHLRWLDTDFDIVNKAGCDSEYIKDPSFAPGWEGIECSNIPSGTTKTFRLKALTSGIQTLYYRAWELGTPDHNCGTWSDYGRDPSSGTCSANCDSFPGDWPVCDARSYDINILIPQPRSGGCPTLFVYDGKDYVKERKSNIHSQEGVDTLDDIVLKTEPVIIDGNYLLQLKETTLPEHSYIDSVKLFVTDSEGKKEAKLLSAKHSKYGDVTAALAKSDDVRTDTQIFDNIDLKFAVPKLKGEVKEFTFEIEGYNPAVNILDRGVSTLGQVITGNMIYKMDIADFTVIAVVVAISLIVVIFVTFKFFVRKS